MAQTQGKRPLGLASVDRDRSGGTPAVMRVAPDSSAFDDFVFEAVPATTPPNSSSFVRELGGEIAKRDPVPVAKTESSSPAPSTATASSVVSLPDATPQLPMATTAPKASAKAATQVVKSEARSSGAEDSSKLAEEGRAEPSVPGASNRDYLELRAQLHRKDEELFKLRTEISARDRSLLELNDKSLEVERSRFELGERLDNTALELQDTQAKLRGLEVELDATLKQKEQMKLAFRRNEEAWKRKSESELDTVRKVHAAEILELTAAHATKLEQLDRAYSSEIARLHTAHSAVVEQVEDKHAAAIKLAETTSNAALANAIASYTKKVQALKEAQESAFAKSEAAHAAERESASLTLLAEKAKVLAEAEAAHKATQNDLSATQATVQFLERAQATSAERISRLQSKVSDLEEQARRANEKIDADAELLSKLRKALSIGLGLLNPSASTPEHN